MDWLKIGSALLLVAMLFFLFPHAKSAIANSPKGSSKDWMGFVVPVAIVILFVVLLIALV
jgi:hypothetical protein